MRHETHESRSCSIPSTTRAVLPPDRWVVIVHPTRSRWVPHPSMKWVRNVAIIYRYAYPKNSSVHNAAVMDGNHALARSLAPVLPSVAPECEITRPIQSARLTGARRRRTEDEGSQVAFRSLSFQGPSSSSSPSPWLPCLCPFMSFSEVMMKPIERERDEAGLGEGEGGGGVLQSP